MDWHHPQWLAAALLVLLLCCADAFFTLILLERGAYEVNPFMASLINDSALLFTSVKIGLTAASVVLLTILARLRAFGRRITVGAILYTVLGLYVLLVAYELWLLERLADAP